MNFLDIPDGRKYLVQHLAKLSQNRPGEIPTLLAGLPAQHQEALQKYCAQAGVHLI